MGRSKGFIGFWNKATGNVYQRKSVERDIQQFYGWPLLLDIVNECKNTRYFRKGKSLYFADKGTKEELRRRLIARDQALIAAIFETGGRILEVLMLQLHHFEVEKDRIYVKGMPIVKRFVKTDEILDIKDEKPTGIFSHLYHWSHKKDGWVRRKWKTEPKIEVRGTLLLPKFEPLVKYLESWLEKTEDYLFPTYYDTDDNRKWISTTRAYQIVTTVGKRLGLELWDHWFRAQRASQLATEYGFREAELDDFFGWKKGGITSRRYAKLATSRQEELMQPEKIRLEPVN